MANLMKAQLAEAGSWTHPLLHARGWAVLAPRHPQREAKLRKLRSLLANPATDEIAVFQNKVHRLSG